MSEIKISFNWVDFPSGADELSLQATFAQASVIVGDVNVTRVVDRRGRTTRDFVTIPLYPLAEWIAANWWPLFEEAEVPSRGTPSSDYCRRHALRGGREGYAFPDLQFFPEGPWTVVKWSPSRTTYQSVEFLETGHDRLDTGQVRQELSDLVDSVIDRLESKQIHESWLQNEWRNPRDESG